MTIGGSIALIVIGAILRYGVTWKPKYLDLHAIGVILMVAGVVGLAVSIAILISRPARASPRWPRCCRGSASRPAPRVAQPRRSDRYAATSRATSVARKIWPVSASRTAVACPELYLAV